MVQVVKLDLHPDELGFAINITTAFHELVIAHQAEVLWQCPIRPDAEKAST